jgi:hypothetical protein
MTPTPSPTPAGGSDITIMAAGDVACQPPYTVGSSTCHMMATGDLIRAANPNYVLALGDLQYEDGTQTQYAGSYIPTWGSFKAITKAVAGGSHDTYGGGYFSTYFGAAAGTPNQNWYSFDTANGWHIIVINSYCNQNGNCAAMDSWLAADLAAHPNSCSIGAWHEPAFTSGTRHNNEADMQNEFQMMANAGVEMILSGHEHNYERLGPYNASGQSDPNGTTYFVVGTGGKSLETMAPSMEPLSRSFSQTTYGVLQLTLHSNSADFEFVHEPGKTFTDSGTITCH